MAGRQPVNTLSHVAPRRDALAAFVERAAGARPVDRDALIADVLDALSATGLIGDGGEADRIWREAAASDPSHKELRSGFLKLAKAADPIEAAACDGDLRAELNAMIRVRWNTRRKRERREGEPSLRGLDWNSLTLPEREEIRVMLRELTARHGSMVMPGRPHRSDLDTRLALLAEVFGRHSGCDRHALGLPHSVEARFIGFAATALEDLQHRSHVSPVALARRWGRIKREEAEAQIFLEREPDQAASASD